MGGNTYGLFRTLGFKKSKFNSRIGGWEYPSLHRQRIQLKGEKAIMASHALSPSMIVMWGGWRYREGKVKILEVGL